ncbi:hypothetical protein ACLVPE_10920, partial [Streptococcus pneumoniae]|nr:hypothetical protein [Streptococcus pneumoniae]MDG7727059.1 hypothetical protein [Streptococcus pneumoniae]MDG7735134.1 hypothetical protein [Streptococcus pneumoniae]MDG7791163.1 hypothetical protein [Streptococcus pneumoniae]MDG8383007.1 hypothetical protein [Streptococcus pneumoniae]
KRNHPGSKLRQGFWMVLRLGVNNWGLTIAQRAQEVDAPIKWMTSSQLEITDSDGIVTRIRLAR